MIHHVDDGWGRPGIFTESKVIMYDFIRGDSIKGVIYNKKTAGGKRIGGPVGLSRDPSEIEYVYLHNIPNLPGAKKVVNGLYWQDGQLDQLEPYKENSNYKVHEYIGYASWFEG